MTDTRAIADGLTEAQRAMLLWACAGYRLLRPGWTRWRLSRKGLVQPWLFAGSWHPTVLGEKVAAILEERKP